MEIAIMRRGLGLLNTFERNTVGTWEEGDDSFSGVEPMGTDSPARPWLFDQDEADADDDESHDKKLRRDTLRRSQPSRRYLQTAANRLLKEFKAA